jgi:pyruvate/2-oxoglutarate dehydrogenase complex dihydrolipoamide dehydrogenase (E3) component
MKVTIIEIADHILPTLLDKEIAEMVKQDLETNCANIILGEELQEVVTSSSSYHRSQCCRHHLLK